MVAGLLVLGQALPAFALDAEALREKIAGGIAFYNARAHLEGQNLYGYSGLRVEPRDEAFRVSLSDFSVLLDVAEKTRLELGDIGLTMTPAGELADDEMFRVSEIELPATMRIAGPDGTTWRTIGLGPVRLDSLWSFAYLTNLNMDILIEGFEMADPVGADLIKVGEVAAELRSLEQDSGVYDMALDIRALGFLSEAPNSKLYLSELAALSKLTDYNLAAAAQDLRDADPEAPGKPAALLETLLDLLLSDGTWSDGSEARLDARGLRFISGAAQGSVEVDFVGLGFALESLNEPLANASFTVSHQGLRGEGLSAAEGSLGQELLPQETAVKVTLDKLPVQRIIGELSSALSNGVAGETAEPDQPAEGQAEEPLPVQPGIVFHPLAEKLRDAVAEAGTTISLSDTRLAMPSAKLQAEGSFALDPEAVLGLSGNLLAELVGLDKLIALAQAAMGDPDVTIRERAAGLIGTLSLLQTYAARGEDDKGGPVDRYELVIDASGAITVNGKPLGPPPPQE